MQVRRQQYSEAGAMLSYPAFLLESSADKESGRLRQNAADAKRMTAFYEYMKDCVLEYCHSDAFPQGGRYYVDYRIREAPEGFDVEILLRLRIRGRSVGSAQLSHRWRDGVLDLQKRERVCKHPAISAK